MVAESCAFRRAMSSADTGIKSARQAVLFFMASAEARYGLRSASASLESLSIVIKKISNNGRVVFLICEA